MSDARKLSGYTTYCIIQGLCLEEKDVKDFECHFMATCGVRIQFVETYLTLPDLDNGKPVSETGGRSDVIFAMHRDDVSKLHTGHRLDMGIRWLDDAISNDPHMYDNRIKTQYI